MVKIDGDGRDNNFGRFLFRFQSYGTPGKLSTTVTIGQDEYVRTKPLGSKKCGLNAMVCYRMAFMFFLPLGIDTKRMGLNLG